MDKEKLQTLKDRLRKFEERRDCLKKQVERDEQAIKEIRGEICSDNVCPLKENKSNFAVENTICPFLRANHDLSFYCDLY